MSTADEGIVGLRPLVDARLKVAQDAREECDDDARDRATGDVTRGHEHPRALVTLRGHLLFGRVLWELAPRVLVDEPSDGAADEDGRGGGQRQIHSNRERERWDGAHLEHDSDHHAEQHQPPRQLPVENALDD